MTPSPLLLLAAGRSGTTRLMSLLAAHPAVIAYTKYPLEFRPFITHAMSDAAPGRFEFEGAEALFRAPLQARGRLSVAEVEAIYAQLACSADKTVTYFAEKTPARRDVEAIFALAPDARFIGLVRDPRDILASARAFDARRGFRGFQEADGDSDEVVVQKYAVLMEGLAANLDRTGAPVVRYEDLVLDPEMTLSVLLSKIGLDASPSVVANCLAVADDITHRPHLTTESPAQSVGRWRQDLSEEVVGLFDRHMPTVLRAFGYA